MRYRNKDTGVILEPRNEVVEGQLRKNDKFEEVADGAASGQTDEKPVSRMNKDELLAKAAELGLAVPDGAKNDDIKAMIKAVSGQ